MAQPDKSEDARAVPPYPSYASFTEMLDWLQDQPEIPVELDRSLGIFQGATGSPLLGGLRFLGLLDGSKPTDALKKLANAGRDERKPLFEQILRQAYGDDFVTSVSSLTPKMFEQHLSDLGTTKGTHRKAVSFLINALKATNVTVPSTIGKKARNRSASTVRRSGTRQHAAPRDAVEFPDRQSASAVATPEPRQPGNTRTIELESGAKVTFAVDRDVFSLPAEDRRWVLSFIDRFDAYGDAPGPVVTDESPFE